MNKLNRALLPLGAFQLAVCASPRGLSMIRPANSAARQSRAKRPTSSACWRSSMKAYDVILIMVPG